MFSLSLTLSSAHLAHVRFSETHACRQTSNSKLVCVNSSAACSFRSNCVGANSFFLARPTCGNSRSNGVCRRLLGCKPGGLPLASPFLQRNWLPFTRNIPPCFPKRSHVSVQAIRKENHFEENNNPFRIKKRPDDRIHGISLYPCSPWPRKKPKPWKLIVGAVLTFLFGFALLIAKGKGRSYIENAVLPPLAATISSQIGREVSLGNVKGISPYGIKLGPVFVGPAKDEFSCGEIAEVKIKVRPFASLSRWQIVLDAVANEPVLFVTQLADWTWLGIPAELEGMKKRTSSDPGLDMRTKLRRKSREDGLAELMQARDSMARKSATEGYCMYPDYDAAKLEQETRDKSDQVSNQRQAREEELEVLLPTKKAQGHASLKDKPPVYKSESSLISESILSKSTTSELVPENTDAFYTHLKSLNTKNEKINKSFSTSNSNANTTRFGADDMHGSNKEQIERKKSLVNEDGVPKDNEKVENYDEEMEDEVDEDDDENDEDDDMANTLRVSDFVFGFKAWIASSIYFPLMQGLQIVRNFYTQENAKKNVEETKIKLLKQSSNAAASYFSERDKLFTDSSKQSNGSRSEDSDTPLKNLAFFQGNSTGVREETKNSDSISAGKEKNVMTRAKNEQTSESKRSTLLHQLSNEGIKDRLQLNGKISSKKFLDEKKVDTPTENSTRKTEFNYGLDAKPKSFEKRKSHERLDTGRRTKRQKDMKAFSKVKEDPVQESWMPIILDKVKIRNGNLLILAYGDKHPRLAEQINGYVNISNSYQKLYAYVSGRVKPWRNKHLENDDCHLSVKVHADILEKKWSVFLKAKNFTAPILERLLEIPIDFYSGKADGNLKIWMSPDDKFPNLRGRLNIQNLNFHIWESPSPFTNVNGSLLFEGQRMFFHDASGNFGGIPLFVSGDMDLNPIGGQYRLSAQVHGVELNELMNSLNAKPPPYPVSGIMKGTVYCRGFLDIPIFEGNVEMAPCHNHNHSDHDTDTNYDLFLASPPSEAKKTIEKYLGIDKLNVVAAYDHIPFTHISSGFIFHTDNCLAEIHGIRIIPVGGGEIRGAGNLWICPEGEIDPESVNVDCWAHSLPADSLLNNYLPPGLEMPRGTLGPTFGEAKIRGALLAPKFDISWKSPESKGSLKGAHGHVTISREYLSLSSSAFSFDLFTQLDTSYPPLTDLAGSEFKPKPLFLQRNYFSSEFSSSPPKFAPEKPNIEGAQLDLKLKGFDLMSLTFAGNNSIPYSPSSLHLKLTGKIKLNGKVKQVNMETEKQFNASKNLERKGSKKFATKDEKNANNEKKEPTILPVLMGDISMSGLKLNQLFIAHNLNGIFKVSSDGFDLDTSSGRSDEHLKIQISSDDVFVGGKGRKKSMEKGNKTLFSLQQGLMKLYVKYQPRVNSIIEVKHLPLDELELASLRGTIEKIDVKLNFENRRGNGLLCVKKPRFSGLQSEHLDAAFRWTGDVITLEKSVLEQSSSRYELQGEYVFPRQRGIDKGVNSRQREKEMEGEEEFEEEDGNENRYAGKEETNIQKDMVSQLFSIISSLGRWRLRLDVPKADISEMIPAARFLSRSRDPDVLFRSKEYFVNEVQNVGFIAENLKEQLEYIKQLKTEEKDESEPEAMPLPGLGELKGKWKGTFEASGGGNGDTSGDFDFHGEDWEWGNYKIQQVSASGDYNPLEGLRLEKVFIQQHTATCHADGTILGPSPNLHFAVLNFPANIIPPFIQALNSNKQASSSSPPPIRPSSTASSPRTNPAQLRGVLHMEGDLRGSWAKPECDIRVRLFDGAIGGVSLGRAELATSVTPESRLSYFAIFEPATQSGHVTLKGSIPLNFQSESSQNHELNLDIPPEEVMRIEQSLTEKENEEKKQKAKQNELERILKQEIEKMSLEKQKRNREEDETVLEQKGNEKDEENIGEMREVKRQDGILIGDGNEDFEIFKTREHALGEIEIDFVVKDGGMMLLTSLSPGFKWTQGLADVNAKIRGTLSQPKISGIAKINRASIRSPVLPKPLTNLFAIVRIDNEHLYVDEFEGKIGKRGSLSINGQLPFDSNTSKETLTSNSSIELKAENLEIRARNVFSGQVDSQLKMMGSLLDPELTGGIKLSRGIVYLSQEKSPSIDTQAQPPAPVPRDAMTTLRSSNRIISRPKIGDLSSMPDFGIPPSGDDVEEEEITQESNVVPISLRLKSLRLFLGPELRLVYPLILNFATSGELELNGVLDPTQVKPRGTLSFENGEVNLVATQVRLNRDHPNRAKFEPEQGLDPTLDLKLVGSDFQLKIQGRAKNWQDNVEFTTNRTGDENTLSQTEAARKFEGQLKESVLEDDGQIAFKKLAAATVETLMPKIETKGEFGQARWRLVSAPQIPNLLSLDPTTDPFKSLANLSFGAEVEVQFGKNIQASVVRQLKESEMATQWTLLYQLNSKLRILFSSISSVDNRLLFEYSASSQN